MLELTPGFGSRPEELLAVRALVVDVEAHNDLYTPSGITARALGISAEDYEPGSKPSYVEQAKVWLENPARLPLGEQQREDRLLLFGRHAGALAGAGLGISPVHTTCELDTTLHGTEEIGEVRLHVVEGAVFSSLLLNAGVVEVEGAAFNETAEVIAAHAMIELSDQIYYDSDVPLINQTIAYAGGIANGLEGVGVSATRPIVQTFRSLERHSQTQTVREWMLAERMGLLDSPGEQMKLGMIGPGLWHRTMACLELDAAWGVVLDLLQSTRYKPGARCFFEDMLASARQNFDYSRREWRYLSEATDFYDNEDYTPIFASIGQRLSEFSSANG